MTGTQLFAFVILPITIAALGWVVALLHDRLTRDPPRGPRHGAAE